MKKGDRVLIYEDPITCKNLEGGATLMRLEKDDGFFEYWFVKFIGESTQHLRKIKKGD